MENPKLLYLTLGRGFRSASPIRKMKGVIDGFSRVGFSITHIGGADLIPSFRAKPNLSVAAGGSGSAARKSRLRRYLSVPLDLLHDICAFTYLACRFNRRSFDVIVDRATQLHSAGFLFAKITGTPILIEWKDNLFRGLPRVLRPILERVYRCKINRANGIIVESEVLRHRLAKECPQAKNIQVAHNAVDLKPDLSPDIDAGRAEPLHIVYAGSYAYYHRMLLLADALELLIQHRHQFRFLLVGDGPDRAELERFVRDKGLNDTVQFRGPVPHHELDDLLRLADVGFVMDTTDLICPIKIQEYMAIGLVPLAPAYKCNQEIVDDMVSGILFRPRDAASFSENALRLFELKRSGRLLDLRKKAQEVARERFSWESTWGRALLQASKNLLTEPQVRQHQAELHHVDR